jgi:hypothetical protein
MYISGLFRRRKGGDIMVTRKDLVIAVLSTFCLVSTLFMIVPTRSQTTHLYDPWIDTDDDGDIDLYDAVELLTRYGSKGTPINKTELLLELQARLDALNATVMAIQSRHCANTEQLMTSGNEITITFPVGMFTTAPNLSVTVFILTGTHVGRICYISSKSVSATSATLSLEAWDGGSWQHIEDSEVAQVSWVAVENNT